MGCNKLFGTGRHNMFGVNKTFLIRLHKALSGTHMNNDGARLSIKYTLLNVRICCFYFIPFTALLINNLSLQWRSHYPPWCETKNAWKGGKVQCVFYILAFNPNPPITGLHHMYPLMYFCLGSHKAMSNPLTVQRQKAFPWKHSSCFLTSLQNQCVPLSLQWPHKSKS